MDEPVPNHVSSPTIQSNPAKSPSSHSLKNKLVRTLWGLVWVFAFRPSPKICWAWRRSLLRLFGAKIGRGCRVLPTVKIWLPSNLQMGDYSCMGCSVDCYCVAPIALGDYATVSQRTFLCTATHAIDDLEMALVATPITIEPSAWVCAEAFLAPGVRVGEGAVVGARAVVTRAVNPWTVVAGNPAKFLRARVIRERSASPNSIDSAGN